MVIGFYIVVSFKQAYVVDGKLSDTFSNGNVVPAMYKKEVINHHIKNS